MGGAHLKDMPRTLTNNDTAKTRIPKFRPGDGHEITHGNNQQGGSICKPLCNHVFSCSYALFLLCLLGGGPPPHQSRANPLPASETSAKVPRG